MRIMLYQQEVKMNDYMLFNNYDKTNIIQINSNFLCYD